MDRDPLSLLAQLLHQRNDLDAQIAAIIKRPMTAGHAGEWIAVQVFDIDLEASAAQAAIDGRFRGGPLDGRSVNIKWYLKREGLLDLTVPAKPDTYLVMTGPQATAVSSRGTTRPWCIDAVYLFDTQQLHTALADRKIGVASNVRRELWRGAEIYPDARNPALPLSPEQRAMLELFAATRS